MNFNDYQQQIHAASAEKTPEQLVLELAELVGVMAGIVASGAGVGNTMLPAETLLARLSELCTLSHVSLDDLALNGVYKNKNKRLPGSSALPF